MNHRQLQIVATLIDCTTLNLFKWSHRTANGWLTVLSAITGGTAYYTNSLANMISGIGRGNSYWNVCSSIFGCVTGALFWKETLSWRAITGIMFGGVSLYLLDGDIAETEERNRKI